MKNFIGVFAFTLLSNALFSQWITNNGFENWSNTNGYNTPDGWTSLNEMTSTSGIFTCIKGTPAPVGNAYVKLISKNIPGVGIVPGMITNGLIDPVTMEASGGVPFNQSPTAFTGKWLFMAAATSDIGFINVYLTHTDDMGMVDTVAIASTLLPDMEMSWVNFSIPFVYLNNNTPDHCLIVASASGHSPLVNSYLYLDNLDFTIPNEVHEKINIGFNVYPNPVQDELIIQSNEEKIMAIQILDANGRICFSDQNLDGLNRREVNVSNWSMGPYFVKIISSESSHVFPIIK